MITKIKKTIYNMVFSRLFYDNINCITSYIINQDIIFEREKRTEEPLLSYLFLKCFVLLRITTINKV